MMNISILIGGGGFHNAPAIPFDLPAERVFDEARIEKEFANPIEHARNEALLTWREFSCVCRAMCGVGGCYCGSGVPATIFHPADYLSLGIAACGEAFLVPCKIVESGV
jgi:hypothetical protein